MKIALIGQPNCGKSTIYNSVAGYKSVTSNFPGSTVKYTYSQVRINGTIADIYDFPGTYSLTANNEAEAQVRDFLLNEHFDVIVNVIDASQLGRSLALTLELLELDTPLIIALNMMDEARRKGIEIDVQKLQQVLGVPVQPTIASKNVGIKELFRLIRDDVLKNPDNQRKRILCQKDVEMVIQEMTRYLEKHFPNCFKVPMRFLAIKLLENDEYILQQLAGQMDSSLLEEVKRLQERLVRLRGKSRESVLALERYAIAMDIFEQVTNLIPPRVDWRDRLDDILLHPIWGYVSLLVLMILIFYFIFSIGAAIEDRLMVVFSYTQHFIFQAISETTLIGAFVKSVLWGISGGVVIVLPYLIPFLIGLTVLEDIGYLPRVAYLMDVFMHRIGLHGTATLPALLGYGCSVPAVMATRILPNRRDKIIAAFLASMVPCSARSVVIFALVAFYLGPIYAFGIYLLNVFAVAFAGRFLSRLLPEKTPGMILEIPDYRLPTPRIVLQKTWLRVREFIMVAWPLLILGSVILGILEYLHWDLIINEILSPLTYILGLPKVVGNTLIFGILRKELSLIMLTQALNTAYVANVLTPTQILTFTIFITFYIPCLATMAVLKRELGGRWMLLIVSISFTMALTLGVITRLIAPLF